MIGSPTIGDVQFLLSLEKAEMNSARTFLRIWSSEGSRFHPMLRHQCGADQPTAQQREEERGKNRAPSKHRRHPWITRQPSLRIVWDHWTEEKWKEVASNTGCVTRIPSILRPTNPWNFNEVYILWQETSLCTTEFHCVIKLWYMKFGIW